MISTDCAINAMEAITDMEHHGPYIGAYIYSTSKIMKYKVYTFTDLCLLLFRSICVVPHSKEHDL